MAAPQNESFGIWTGVGVAIACVLVLYAVVSTGRSQPPPPTTVARPAPAPVPAPAPQLSRCQQRDVFDRAVSGGAQPLRDYIRECGTSGPFRAQAVSALESRLYDSALACIRSTCSLDGCLTGYMADFPSGNRLPNLRSEVDSARNGPRCKPVAATFTFRVCNRTSNNLQIAVMGRQSPSSPWIVQGWAMAYAGGCGSTGNYAKGEFFAAAVGPNGMRWGNRDVSLCVTYGQRFDRQNSSSYNCQPPEALLAFQRFQVTDDQLTWTLN